MNQKGSKRCLALRAGDLHRRRRRRRRSLLRVRPPRLQPHLLTPLPYFCELLLKMRSQSHQFALRLTLTKDSLGTATYGRDRLPLCQKEAERAARVKPKVCRFHRALVHKRIGSRSRTGPFATKTAAGVDIALRVFSECFLRPSIQRRLSIGDA